MDTGSPYTPVLLYLDDPRVARHWILVSSCKVVICIVVFCFVPRGLLQSLGGGDPFTCPSSARMRNSKATLSPCARNDWVINIRYSISRCLYLTARNDIWYFSWLYRTVIHQGFSLINNTRSSVFFILWHHWEIISHWSVAVVGIYGPYCVNRSCTTIGDGYYESYFSDY